MDEGARKCPLQVETTADNVTRKISKGAEKNEKGGAEIGVNGTSNWRLLENEHAMEEEKRRRWVKVENASDEIKEWKRGS